MKIKIGIPLYAKEIAEAIDGELIKTDESTSFNVLSTDSRNLSSGDLFIALNGKTTSGELFIKDVSFIGATPITSRKNVRGIYVRDTGEALLLLAAYYKTKLKKLKYTIAITGSVGKTTTKEFLGILLGQSYKVHKTPGNFNNRIGVPLTILSAPSDTEILITEMGMNHVGEIAELSKYVAHDIAIITNIGTAHIGNLGSKENIAHAKLEILQSERCKHLIVPYEEHLLKKAPMRYTFSRAEKDADLYIIYNEGKVFIRSNNTFIESNFHLSDNGSLDCLCAAASAALICKIPNIMIKRQISLISKKNTRQTFLPINDFFVLSDFYNASLESVVSALEYMNSLSEYPAISALLGDILELGDMTYIIHKKIGEECAKYNLKRIYLFGKFAKFIKNGAVENGMSESSIFINENIDSPELTANTILSEHLPGELILFKASHASKISEILKLLQAYK